MVDKSFTMDISVISLSTSWTLIGLTSAGNWTHSRSYKVPPDLESQ